MNHPACCFSSRALVAPHRRDYRLVELHCSLLRDVVEGNRADRKLVDRKLVDRNQAERVVAWDMRPVLHQTQPDCREQGILGLRPLDMAEGVRLHTADPDKVLLALVLLHNLVHHCSQTGVEWADTAGTDRPEQPAAEGTEWLRLW